MTKNRKYNLVKESSMSTIPKESPFFKFADQTKQWQQIWGNIITKTQGEMLDFYKNKSNSTFAVTKSSLSHPHSFLDSQMVTDTFSSILPKIFSDPQKVMDLQKEHLSSVQQIWKHILNQKNGQDLKPLYKVDARDKRFKNPQWRENPALFFIQQIYLLNAQLLRQTVECVQEIDEKTKMKLAFYTNHLIDALSPTNFPLTNPDVMEKIVESKGETLIQGFRNYLQHAASQETIIPITDMNAFTLGENLATTPGKVVYKNDLFELIQYSPTTKTVAEIPLLIIPPWINKYYIFDLRSDNSFVKWMVASGLTVFIISWVNPDQKHSKKSLSDFVVEGALEALDQVLKRTKRPSANVLGYCTGGILLNCLLSYLKSKSPSKINCASFVASPVDFKEAGDLLVFVCEQQLKKLENHVQKKGFLEGQKMVQAFNLLRANDLIWSSYVSSYLLGKDPTPFDMLYWNCDAVRMPAKMHTQFLRQFYLENRLMQPGGIHIKRVKVDLSKNTLPTFVMAAIDDHIAPWKSIFPFLGMIKGEKKFVLAGSGHVAGVINHPDKKKYHYWSGDFKGQSPTQWVDEAEKITGSWWPEWRQWLESYCGTKIKPPKIKDDLGEAPGTFVKVQGE